MSMGSILGQYIHDHCRSRRAFCADIGFRESTVSNWCNDRVSVPLPKIAIMAEYFEEYTNEPPSVFVFRLVMAEPTTLKIIQSYQKKQRKK